MEKGDRVKVLSVHADTMPNLYNTPTDITHLVGQEGVIEVAYTDGTYGIEFDEDKAYWTRRYTGILFRAEELEVVQSIISQIGGKP